MIRECSCCGEKKTVVVEVNYRYCEDCWRKRGEEFIKKEDDVWDSLARSNLIRSMYNALVTDDNTFHELGMYDFNVSEKYRQRILDLGIKLDI